MLIVSGNSRSSEVQKIFARLNETIVQNSSAFKDGIVCNFQFENVISLTTINSIVKLIRLLKGIVKVPGGLKIYWNYYTDDIHVRENGEMISQAIDVAIVYRVLQRHDHQRNSFRFNVVKQKQYYEVSK